MLRRFLVNYIARHRNRTNQVLHAIGLPVTFLVPIGLLCYGLRTWAIASFVVGYLLQFLGHWMEGNDAGEVILVKKWLGRPYVEFGPGAKQSKLDG